MEIQTLDMMKTWLLESVNKYFVKVIYEIASQSMQGLTSNHGHAVLFWEHTNQVHQNRVHWGANRGRCPQVSPF